MRPLTSLSKILRHFTIAGIAAASTFVAHQSLAQAFHVVNGTWIAQNQSQITIAPCEQGLCGAISHIVLPTEIVEKYGEEVLAELQGDYRDVNNENPELRDRPIMGLNILILTEQQTATRYAGRIYNPQDGKTYDGFVDVLDGNRIMLSGCVMWGTVCQGEEWIRAPEIVAENDEILDTEATTAAQ